MTTANSDPPFHPVVATLKYQLLLEPMGTYMTYYGTVTGLQQNLITNTQQWAILYRIHRGLKHFQEPGLRNMTKNIQLTQQAMDCHSPYLYQKQLDLDRGHSSRESDPGYRI